MPVAIHRASNLCYANLLCNLCYWILYNYMLYFQSKSFPARTTQKLQTCKFSNDEKAVVSIQRTILKNICIVQTVLSHSYNDTSENPV